MKTRRDIGSQKDFDIFQFSTYSRSRVFAILLTFYDILVVNAAYFLILWLRYDCRFSMIDRTYLLAWVRFVPFYTVFCLVIFRLLWLYRSIWRYVSYSEFLHIVAASVITAVFHIMGITLLFQRMPISYYVLGALLQFFFIFGIRFSYRFFLLIRNHYNPSLEASYYRVMLIGAGKAGEAILREINNSPELHEKVVCMIDDDPNKRKRSINGVPVVGGRDDILFNVEKYRIDRIFLTMPGATVQQRRDILNICKETACELKNLPAMSQILEGTVSLSDMKNVEAEDLLGRQPIQVDMDEIFRGIAGKVILVTGGGGSIGSELCRQIASHQPKQLIIFDIYENNAYAIQVELADKYPELNLTVLIGSVRDSRRMNSVFSTYHPDIVYHAAAHKHVPLMEFSPCEAIKNNTAGTYITARAAIRNHCKQFVLLSTDKAVNPVNIMGASKRLCEMIIQTFAEKIQEGKADEIPDLSVWETYGGEDRSETVADEYSRLEPFGTPETKFVAVRFGNVLGSNGSVVPRFKEQIAKGGPVTVTHPDIIRYFMTIPEAVSLVLQAGNYAKGGEIFVLDMGSAVKIDTLARNLIKLSGLKPDVDIQIEYTGLRPGEKLYEETLMAEEGLRKTRNDLIYIGQPIPFETEIFLRQLRQIVAASYQNVSKQVLQSLLRQAVPTYHPSEGE